MNIRLFDMAVDCSQPSIFWYFYSIVERADESRQNWTPAKNGRFGRFELRSLSLSCALKNTEAVNSLTWPWFFSAEGRRGVTTVKQNSNSAIRLYSLHQSYTLEMKSIYIYLACLLKMLPKALPTSVCKCAGHIARVACA